MDQLHIVPEEAELTSKIRTLGRVTRTHPMDRRLHCQLSNSKGPDLDGPLLSTRDTLSQWAPYYCFGCIPQSKLIDSLFDNETDDLIRQRRWESKLRRLFR